MRLVTWRRVEDTVVGAVLPAVCFALAWDFGPDWQSGRLDDYGELFLSGVATPAFLPLLILAATAQVMATWWPRVAAHRLARVLVASGLPLAAQYALGVALVLEGWRLGWQATVALTILATPIFLLVPRYAVRLIRLLLQRLGRFVVWALALLIGLVAATWGDEEPGRVAVGVVVFVSLVAAPFWAFGVHLRWCLEWWREDRPAGTPSVLRLAVFPFGAWLVAWALAWRVALHRMLVHYASLPTEPNCFLATVAARGHRSWVGGGTGFASGRSFPVTRQLRRFKAIELVMLWLVPAVHRPLRLVYDAVGRPLAACLRGAYVADLLWLALKPVELATALVLQVVVANAGEAIEGIWSEPAALSRRSGGRRSPTSRPVRRRRCATAILRTAGLPRP